MGSCGEPAFTAKERQQRQQRQPEDAEMIAFDAFEELNPGPLHLISPDAGGHRRAGKVEIGFQERVRKCAHRQTRAIGRFEQYAVVAYECRSAMQLMGTPGKREQLLARAHTVPRLRDPPPVERENLVGAQDNVAGPREGYLPGLRAGEQSRERRGLGIVRLRLERALVELGRNWLDRNSG